MVMFHHDPKIFGAKAAFKPARLFKMARSKAYLFGGVEIRWKCASSLIKDDTPAEEIFHFERGLSDYLKSLTGAKPTVTTDMFTGRVERKGEGGHGNVRMGGCVGRAPVSARAPMSRTVSFNPIATPCRPPKGAPMRRACARRSRRA